MAHRLYGKDWKSVQKPAVKNVEGLVTHMVTLHKRSHTLVWPRLALAQLEEQTSRNIPSGDDLEDTKMEDVPTEEQMMEVRPIVELLLNSMVGLTTPDNQLWSHHGFGEGSPREGNVHGSHSGSTGDGYSGRLPSIGIWLPRHGFGKQWLRKQVYDHQLEGANDDLCYRRCQGSLEGGSISIPNGGVFEDVVQNVATGGSRIID
ncbi:ty3-gypsy retrotransposon protein [Cucumis melo var. makuwa]|uniref:Ty3-gypsy retrotransposon protein n=1 Tax=Cucumis melo var. makuwa TaxID=1194695 RepID=A0A5D3CCZ1_CUCMM|nr:ty3-gypsy retrotransposon protein [Cucumis melo var. makuwa]TYK09723.1 ty3-gypsy retrotransposon protein [Cucumis melo var. makuwa]